MNSARRMPFSAAGILAFSAMVAFGCLAWGWKHRGGSVDMALHYALVEFIRENWAWPTLRDMHMGEMNQYPPVSHTVAAVLGVLTGSSFLGLHLASILSAMALYATLFVLLRFRMPLATLIATAVLAATLVALQYTHAFLGREITGNFFYPQLFGETCVFALVLLRSRLAPNAGGDIILAAGATLLLGWVYPIAAVQWAGIAVAWRLLSMLQSWHETRRLHISALLATSLLAVSALAAIVFHPLFRIVSSIATNEGTVATRIPGHLVIPATIILGALAAVLGSEFVRGRLTLRAADAFVALCAGVAAASLAQAAAYYWLGMGSRYGVYKHIFAVNTLLIAAVAVSVVHFAKLGRTSSTACAATLARFAFVPATLIAIIAGSVPWRGHDLTTIVRSERFLRSSTRQIADVRSHAIFLGGSAIEKFGFSMGVLRLPKETSYALIYTHSSTPQRRQALIKNTPLKYAFVPSDAVGDAACAIHSDQAARLTLVSLACHAIPVLR
jgi:hypothetical protein